MKLHLHTNILKIIKKTLFRGILALLTLLGLTLLTYHLAYLDRIYPGVQIANLPVGNQSLIQATSQLDQAVIEALTEHSSLELVYGNRSWSLDLESVGLQYEAGLSAQKAYQLGRDQTLWQDLETKFQTWFFKKNLPLSYSLNEEQLEAVVSQIAEEVFIPSVNPEIQIQNQTISIQPGENGQELKKELLLKEVSYRLGTLNWEPISLPIHHLILSVTPEQIENTRQRAEKLIGKKIILVDHETQWELTDQDLVALLSFTNGYHQEKIADWAANLSESVNRPPENAAFQFEAGRAIEFRAAKDGQTLDENKTIDLLVELLRQLESDQLIVEAKLPIEITPPAIKTADVNRLGIQQLIGRGESFYRGSIASRIHNLQLAASRINGFLIPPGETFSFNQAVGEISKNTGYQEAYIIREGRTVLDDGGGACQVSTTLFRAALNAGLPIVERHAHAYRVAYYEQNFSPGLDATVFAPTSDLKFTNDTPAYILIQTTINNSSRYLAFDFYGTDDGRISTLSKSRVWDQAPPPPDLYQDDPTLPAGTIKQIDWKSWGAKVAFDYQVIRGSEKLQDRTFYSVYRPWQAIFLRGTGPAQ